MKSMLLLSLFSLFVSCAAQIVQSPRTPAAAPKDYSPVGIVKYKTNGLATFVEKRREDAFLKMDSACPGGYSVLDESARQDGMSFVNNGFGGVSATPQSAVYIRFSCN